MGIATLQSQIGQLEKDILDLSKKIYVEENKILDKEKQIGTVHRSINKSTSTSTLKSKSDQVIRYKKEILGLQTKINDYEKKKRGKQQDLIRKKEALRKQELSEQKREQKEISRIMRSSDEFTQKLRVTSYKTEEDLMGEINNKTDENMGEVFVSYSWDSKEHEAKVFDFVNHLRNNGFLANMDKGLSQQQTATNFLKMMYQAMHNHPKVIVILSEGYKTKADAFIGGVGTEYEWMIGDINDNPNKYILASFNGRDNNIIPAGFKGRDIVDLSESHNMTALYSKLMDHKPYVFSEVAKTKPKLPVHIAEPFAVKVVAPEEPISVEPFIKETGAGLFAKKYRSIDFTLKFEIVNTSGGTIEGINYTIKLPRELDLDHYHDADPDGFVNYERSFNKLYRSQKVQSEGFSIRVAHQNISRIMDSVIKVEVYTEQGPIIKEFPTIELIKVRPGGESYVEAVPLSPDLFIL
jgi:hypothetical protein